MSGNIERRCENCDAYGRVDGFTSTGECHFNPPVRFRAGTVFPTVCDNDWCCHFQPKTLQPTVPRAEPETEGLPL